MKKTFARLFIILFLVSGVYFSEPPKKTEAFFIDIPNFIKEYGLDTLVTILQTRIINKMVNDTVNWAVGGFDGEPGFLNNWDDFLKDTSYAVIDSAFTNATRVALEAQQNVEDPFLACQVENNLFEPPACDDQFLNNFEGCIYGLDPIEDEDEYRQCEQTRDDQAFAYELCLDQHNDYERLLAERCGSLGDPGGAAQQNYNMWKSGELTTTRAVAGTIARFGSQQLNYDPLSAIIKGEGETLTKLLGSQEQKDAFRHDFAAGGILGYIALADPHNSALGRSGLTQQFLSGKAGGAVTKAVDNLQTPLKMFDRTECEEFEKDIDGNDTSTCKRAITTTPGDVVAQKLHTNLVKEEDQSIVARELSDVLAKAVGRLTNSLLQQGLDKVTQKKPSSGGGGEAPVRGSEFGDGNYQSSYDVLGLSDDGEPGSQGTGGTQGGAGDQPYNPDQPFNTDIVDGSAPFVGGPEDAKGQRWDSGPELIINLQEVLEPAINNTRKELGFYLEAERIMKGFKDLIIQLDRCIPGPDYNWQERVNDRFEVDSDEHNDANLRKLAIAEMKQMTRDSRVNIPGAMRMLGMVVTTLKSGDEDQKGILQMKDKKQNILINLLNIRSGVEIDFNRYKEAIHHNLPLFSDQWDKLSPAEQLELFSLPLMDMDGNPITPEIGEDPYLMGSYYLFKSEANETPASVYESRPDVAKKAVISYAWDLWRTKKGEEPATDTEISGTKQKSNLRYRYYIMQNSISTQANVLEAELTKDEAIAGGKTLIGYLSDCVQFAAYSLGVDYQLVSEALQTDGLGRLPHGGGNLQQVSARNGKSDADIKQFILDERAKQSARNPDDPSIFVTDVITSEGSLSESILGFNSEEEKMNYFEDFYPYEGQNFPPATSIVPLLQSNYARSFMPLGGMIPGGYALCRFTTTWRTLDCLDRWYWTKSLEYKMIMAGV